MAVQLISVAEIRENDDANSVQKLLAKHLLLAPSPPRDKMTGTSQFVGWRLSLSKENLSQTENPIKFLKGPPAGLLVPGNNVRPH